MNIRDCNNLKLINKKTGEEIEIKRSEFDIKQNRMNDNIDFLNRYLKILEEAYGYEIEVYISEKEGCIFIQVIDKERHAIKAYENINTFVNYKYEYIKTMVDKFVEALNY